MRTHDIKQCYKTALLKREHHQCQVRSMLNLDSKRSKGIFQGTVQKTVVLALHVHLKNNLRTDWIMINCTLVKDDYVI